MRKRLLSILLTACMVWSLLPASAWAAEGPVVAPGGSIADEASAKTAFGEDNIQIEGTTITLKTDIEAELPMQFWDDGSHNYEWTLDLNEHSLTMKPTNEASKSRMISVGEYMTLTLQGNGEVIGQTNTYNSSVLGMGEAGNYANYIVLCFCSRPR